jgi:hypothetical protein
MHLLGLDHKRVTYYFNGRHTRLTDVAGELIRQIVGTARRTARSTTSCSENTSATSPHLRRAHLNGQPIAMCFS